MNKLGAKTSKQVSPSVDKLKRLHIFSARANPLHHQRIPRKKNKCNGVNAISCAREL